MALPDGTYTFTNAAFATSQPTLSNGSALGHIVGFNTAQPQKWIARKRGELITIRSGIHGVTSFASVSESVQGAILVGSFNTFHWVVHTVPGEEGRVFIIAPGTNLAWNLTGGNNGAEINLQPVSLSDVSSVAQWIPAPVT